MKLKELIKEYGDYEVTIGLMNLLKEPKKESKSIWNLEKGDKFFYTWDTKVSSGTWIGTDVDIACRKIGNVFLTEEDADKELKRREVEVELKKMAKGYEFILGKDNWFIYCNTDRLELDYETEVYYKANDIYFASREDVIKAVKEIGEARIIQDYFQIEYSKEEEENEYF